VQINLSVTVHKGYKDSISIFLEEQNENTWIGNYNNSSDEDYSLIIETDTDKKRVVKITKGKKIDSPKADIENAFFVALEAENEKKALDENSGFDNSIENNSVDIVNEKDPYDPKLIRVEPKNFSIFQVLRMIDSDEIDISPDFQRGFVWTDITRKSRLIESLLLRIPIPMFYLSQDNDGVFQVVDGIQRLSVISQYCKNGFRLKNLEYLKDCEGKWYEHPTKSEENLQRIYSRRIEQTQLYFNVIDPQTPDKVKYDIFKRINTGGKSLNSQEIRNCLSSVRVRSLLKEMVAMQSFLEATCGSVSAIRMADKEIVLRFIAFYLLDCNLREKDQYRGDMDEFLNETIDLLEQMDDSRFFDIKESFNNAMINAYTLFKSSAFRKTRFINKSLFLSLSRVLYKYDSSKIGELSLGDVVRKALMEEIRENVDYSNALSMGTNDAKNVTITYDVANKIIGRFIK